MVHLILKTMSFKYTTLTPLQKRRALRSVDDEYMRRRVNLIIDELQSTAEALETNGNYNWSSLMLEAAQRLRTIDKLENELEEAHILIDKLKDKIACSNL